VFYPSAAHHSSSFLLLSKSLLWASNFQPRCAKLVLLSAKEFQDSWVAKVPHPNCLVLSLALISSGPTGHESHRRLILILIVSSCPCASTPTGPAWPSDVARSKTTPTQNLPSGLKEEPLQVTVTPSLIFFYFPHKVGEFILLNFTEIAPGGWHHIVDGT
jgi:hypothetical protein